MQVKASVLCLTYNQEKFVAGALRSILNQDYLNLELIVSDDNSQDRTWEVIQETIRDHPRKHQVILNLNSKNIGIVANFNKAFELSSGELIFTAAGDDISMSNRCSQSIKFWASKNMPDLIAADGYDMDFDGVNLGIKKSDNLENWDLDLWHKQRPYFFGASHMMNRSLININALDVNLPYEDQCLVFRAILKKSCFRLPEPLIKHRRGGVSQSTTNSINKNKKELLIQGVNSGLIELSQMIEDAKILGKEDDFLLLALPLYAEYEFASMILKSESKFDSIKKFFLTKNVRLSKKIRYLNYSIAPSLMEMIYQKKWTKKNTL